MEILLVFLLLALGGVFLLSPLVVIALWIRVSKLQKQVSAMESESGVMYRRLRTLYHQVQESIESEKLKQVGSEKAPGPAISPDRDLAKEGDSPGKDPDSEPVEEAEEADPELADLEAADPAPAEISRHQPPPEATPASAAKESSSEQGADRKEASPEAQEPVASQPEEDPAAEPGASEPTPEDSKPEPPKPALSRPEPPRPKPQPTPAEEQEPRQPVNVLAIVGVLVLFVGIAGLIQYAVSEGWFSFPVELRLAGIGIAAMGGVAFGWVQRIPRRAFGLTLQGGSIGILLMTVFSAFRFYELMPTSAALIIASVIVAATGILAVTQNASALAVLAILAGFLSPILMSSGSGNHVGLFSYYGVLNVAIMGIALKRSWPWLNLLGFGFTFGVGVFWGVLNFSEELIWSTLPFVVLYYALYLSIPFIEARRSPDKLGIINGILVLANPIGAFAALSLLFLEPMPMAYSAFGIAGVNGVLGWVLLRRFQWTSIGRAHAWIALVFATLAIPLAFSADVTVAVFALEALALCWLGVRNDNRILRQAAPLLFLLASLFFASQSFPEDRPFLLNAVFMSGLCIALTSFAAAFLYRNRSPSMGAGFYYVFAMFWWLLLPLLEPEPVELGLPLFLIGYYILSLLFVALANRLHSAPLLKWSVAGFAILILAPALVHSLEHDHLFSGYGLLLCGAYALVGMASFWLVRDETHDGFGWAHGAWLLFWGGAFCLYLDRLAVGFDLEQGWVVTAFCLPWIFIALALRVFPWVIGLPWRHYGTWRATHEHVFHSIVGILLFFGLFTAGGAAPLNWVPVLNPLELTLIVMAALIVLWIRNELLTKSLQDLRNPLIAAIIFVMITSLTLRSVHHLGDVSWGLEIWNAPLTHTSLTIVWSLFGVVSWVVGSRRANRGVWVVGAMTMGLVLIKLVFVDRTHLGDLLGIGSFIGFGLLCLLVGYLAPAPPSQPQTKPMEPSK